MNIKVIALVTSFALFSSLSFAQSTPLKVQNNEQLTQSVNKIQQSLVGIKKDLKRAAKLLDNQSMMNLFQRLEDVSQDVDSLRGSIEEQGHLQQRLQKRQRELYLDLDRRIREIELKATAPVQNSAPIPVPDISQTANMEKPKSAPGAPTEALKDTTKPTKQAPVKTSTNSTKSVKLPVANEKKVNNTSVIHTATPAQPMSKERAEYQKAFDLLKEGRYSTAKAAFKSFLLKYPNSSYAGNAQYWSGEANYVTRQFATAMTEFKAVITKYRSSNKVPDAMLKLGYTFYETRQMDNAKKILNELVKRFPKSTATRLALKRLNRMKREGL